MKNKLYKYLLLSILSLSLIGCSKKEESAIFAEIEETVSVQDEVQQESLPTEEVVEEIISEEVTIIEEEPRFIEDALGDTVAIRQNIDRVLYDIYENGAKALSTSASGFVLKEEIEYEGKTYPVVCFSGYGSADETQNYTIPFHIKYIEKMENYDVVNLTIPDTVELIGGGHVFWGLEELETITIADNVRFEGNSSYGTFGECRSLKSVVLPKGVKNLRCTFYECSSLEKVILPNTVKVLEDEVFYGCTSLTNIELPNSLENIRHSVFEKSNISSITIPDKVAQIGRYVFKDCTNLSTINLGEGVYIINEGVFMNCTSLLAIDIPEGVTCIENSLFEGCVNLTSITLPDKITVIRDRAFYDCTNLSEIKLPNKVQSIRESAFENCKGLTTIYLPQGMLEIGNNAFRGCDNLTQIILESGVSEDIFTQLQEEYPDIEIVRE